MQGLSGEERVGCTKLLQSLQKSDLLSLCDTVTNKLIAVESDVGKCTITEQVNGSSHRKFRFSPRRL